MAYFDFTNLIRKYTTSFDVIVSSEGYYNDSGDWMPEMPVKRTLQGAIISMRESRILRSEGVYTNQDKALYMLEPLDGALKGARVIHDGEEYSVGNELDNAQFTGVWAYVLKYVSVFDDGGGVNG